jgi:putative FmdB family regulatory protein
MPTYEYACKSCGHQWEEIQKISEAPLTECPECHLAEAQRLISGGNFILKGGGWYADAYSSAKPKADSAKSESKTEGKGESESKGKGESAAPAAAATASAPSSSAPAAPSTTPSSTPTKT